MKILKEFIWIFLIFPLVFYINPVFSADSVAVEYAAHISEQGWSDPVKNGEVAGTTGQDRAIEALKINATLPENTLIEYQSYVNGIGWESDWHADGEQSGTTGEGRYLEAVRIQLTGAGAGDYDVYYRSHISDLGWLDWAADGEKSGSADMSRKLQALQIKIVKKGSEAPGESVRAFVYSGMPPVNKAETHIQNTGWVESNYLDTVIGITGESKQIEALKLTYADENKSGIEYKLHLENIGWESDWHRNGELSGTVGENRKAEAVQIRLTGGAAEEYDLYYQAHSSDFGWLDWAKNGEIAGSVGCDKKLEAIHMKLVKKGAAAPGSTFVTYREPVDQDSFRARIYGAWLDTERKEEAVYSYVSGFSEYYMFSGYNQTFNGIEGYYEILSANSNGGKIRVVDQRSGEPVEIYIDFKDLPANQLRITQDGKTHLLIAGDTTDRKHYSFSGVMQYGQLAVVELKTAP